MKKEYNLLTEVQMQIQCMFRTLLYSRPMWLRTCKTLNIYPLDHHHAVIKMRYLLHNQMLNKSSVLFSRLFYIDKPFGHLF